MMESDAERKELRTSRFLTWQTGLMEEEILMKTIH